MATPSPPSPVSARFTLELEFVLCLSHPAYLQHLAVTYPHLLNKPTSPSRSGSSRTTSSVGSDSDASRFACYLKYLYDYWRTPEYSKYLTYPGAALRNLELLQQDQFRKDLIRPDVIARLGEMPAVQEPEPATAESTALTQEQEEWMDTAPP